MDPKSTYRRSESQRKYRAKKKAERDKSKAEALPVKSKRKLSKTYELVEREAREIDELEAHLGKVKVSTALQVGKMLDSAHEKLANHGDGVYYRWCRERLGLERKTADRRLNLYHFYRDKDWDFLSQSFDLSALVTLAENSTPRKVRKLAMNRAKQGEKVTNKWVRFIMRAREDAPLKPKPDEEPEPEEPITEAIFHEATRGSVKNRFLSQLKRLPTEKLLYLYENFNDFWPIISQELERKVTPEVSEDMRSIIDRCLEAQSVSYSRRNGKFRFYADPERRRRERNRQRA